MQKNYCQCGCGKQVPKKFARGHNLRVNNAMHKGGLDRYEVDTETDCWNWLGYLSKGYGVVSVDGINQPAHVAMYTKLKGSIPESLILDHKCRNRRCVNPEHLEPVTYAENTRRGICTKLTHEQVIQIKRLKGKMTAKQIIEVLGLPVAKSTIWHIHTERLWKDLDNGVSV